jgi:hypothetical protein
MARSAAVSIQKRQRHLWGIVLSCWFGATFLFCYATYDSINRWRILHGSSAQARVESMHQRRHQGSNFYSIGADFVDARNEPYWVELPVEQPMFVSLHQGDLVDIRYRPSYPVDALLASDSWFRLRNVGALFAALGLYAAGRIRWRRWQQESQKLP